MHDNSQQLYRPLACLLFTSTGRIIVQWEGDTPLPVQYIRLALLLASVLRFGADGSVFSNPSTSSLHLKNGHAASIATDADTSLSSAVIYRYESEDKRGLTTETSCATAARLQSVAILTTFLEQHRTEAVRVSEADRVDAEQQAEAYTLSSALEGGSIDGEASEGTRPEFLAFQHTHLERLVS